MSELLQAGRADSLVDSLGVGVHLLYPGVYMEEDPWVTIPARLEEIGLRRIREGVQPLWKQTYGGGTTTYSQPLWDHLTQLWEDKGIKWHGLLTPFQQFNPSYQNPTYPFDNIFTLGELEYVLGKLDGAMLESFECLNEPDLFWDEGSGWVANTNLFAASMPAHLAAHGFAGFPLTGSALGHPWDPTRYPALGGAMYAHVNRAAIHTYDSPGAIDQQIAWVREYCGPTMPIWVTECGNSSSTATNGVTAIVQSKYGLRRVFGHWKRGIERTFFYELCDQGSDPADFESNFGMLDRNRALKPWGTSLKNLIALLDDGGATGFTPGEVPFGILGPSSLTCQYTLLQKANGKYYLAIWNEVTSNDSDATQALTLAFHGNGAFNGKVYRPSVSQTEQSTFGQVNMLALTVPDDVLLVEFNANPLSLQASTQVEADCGAFATGTSAGDLSAVSCSGLTQAPQLLIVASAHQDPGGAARLSLGVASAPDKRYCLAQTTFHAAGGDGRMTLRDNAIGYTFQDGSNPDGELDLASIGSGAQFVPTVDNAFAASREFAWLALAGLRAVAVQLEQLPATGQDWEAVVGFAPEFALILGAHPTSINGLQGGAVQIPVGWCSIPGQRFSVGRFRALQTPTDTAQSFDNSRCWGSVNASSDAVAIDLEFLGFTSRGIRFRQTGGSGTVRVIVVAGQGASILATDTAFKVGTGAITPITTPFLPRAILALSHPELTAYNGVGQAVAQIERSLGWAVSPSKRAAFWWSDEDGQNPSDSHAAQNTAALLINRDTATGASDQGIVDLDSVSSLAINLNQDTAASVAGLATLLVLGDPAVCDMRPYRARSRPWRPWR